MKRTLLLNSNGEPLQFMDGIRAIRLLIRGRAEVANGLTGNPSFWEDVIVTPSKNFRLPAIVKLNTYVNIHRISKKPPRFQKKVLFNRDAWSCQYCGKTLCYNSLSVDHILPVSRGGRTSWKNCVAACTSCNMRKGSKTPEEAGMKLRSYPVEPSLEHFWDIPRSSLWHNDWDVFMSTQS